MYLCIKLTDRRCNYCNTCGWRTVFRLSILLLLFQNSISSFSQNYFLENKNRFPNTSYTRKFDNGMAYYNGSGLTILLTNPEDLDSLWHTLHHYKKLSNDFTVRHHRIDLQFVGSRPCDIEPKYISPTVYNIYKGNDPSKWVSGIRAWQQITYRNLYEGIDWEILGSANSVKHNYIVSSKGNADDIKIRYSHHDGLSLKDGRLIIKTSVGNIIEQKPFAFQIIGKDTIEIPCEFELKGIGNNSIVGFKLGNYDKNETLIIDPILVFSTYSGSEGDNFGFTSTYDSHSNLYAGGIVDGGTGTNGGPFPVTAGAFQVVYSGGIGQAPANLPCDIGINKFDSAGLTLLYSTYLGGSRDEYPHSLVVDNADNLLVMGTCYSPDFPIDSIAYDNTFNGNTDIFIVKLSEDGSNLLASTYIGGTDFDGLNTRSLRYNYADDFRGDIIVDSANNVYVASTTNSVNFPVLNAMQNSRASVQDGCVFSLNPNLTALRFSTFLGGNSDDAMYSIRLYGDTFLYVGGGTASNAMAFSVNGLKNSYTGGRSDGFIAKMDIFGNLVTSTYFGTNTYDQIYFLDIDASGQVYAAGQTEGNLTRTSGTYGKSNTGQFIVRFSPNISVMNLSVTFGNRTNNPEISPSAFLVDKCDIIYFSGWGSPITDGILHSLTTKDLEITPDAVQKTTDNSDFYLLVLNKGASKLLYATYYGGNQTQDHVDGGTSRFDKKGVVYQSVCASCPDPNQHFDDFPVSPNAVFKLNLSPRCSNATFKLDFQINFNVDAKFTANPVKGCQPLDVKFTNQSQKGRSFFWDYGDGSPIDTNRSPSHVFQNPGKYMVKLTTVDSFSCNVSIFDSLEIEVLEKPKADFVFSSKECSREFEFENKSENYIEPEWDFGDSTGKVNEENPKHTFLKNGLFKTILQVKHPISGCTDTQSVNINLNDDPTSNVKVPNVFTPNQDNFNECFTLSGLMTNCDEAEIWIYDRWGILLFNGMLPQECWNGKVNNIGNEAPDGVYYYILDFKSKEGRQLPNQRYEGIIHLIR